MINKGRVCISQARPQTDDKHSFVIGKRGQERRQRTAQSVFSMLSPEKTDLILFSPFGENSARLCLQSEGVFASAKHALSGKASGGAQIMRLDKYLKVSRLIKRRTVANDACDSERVAVNGRTVKASYTVKVGDVIEMRFGQKTVKVEVLSINEHASKADAPAMYREIV